MGISPCWLLGSGAKTAYMTDEDTKKRIAEQLRGHSRRD
jgi:hypothetical protein